MSNVRVLFGKNRKYLPGEVKIIGEESVYLELRTYFLIKETLAFTAVPKSTVGEKLYIIIMETLEKHLKTVVHLNVLIYGIRVAKCIKCTMRRKFPHYYRLFQAIQG